jgi:hypothetical protein
LEQLKSDIATKNEKNDKLISEWASLTDNQKFFRLSEDPFKEPAVRFVRELTSSGEGIEPSNQQTVELKDEALRMFEGAICEAD